MDLHLTWYKKYELHIAATLSWLMTIFGLMRAWPRLNLLTIVAIFTAATAITINAWRVQRLHEPEAVKKAGGLCLVYCASLSFTLVVLIPR